MWPCNLCFFCVRARFSADDGPLSIWPAENHRVTHDGHARSDTLPSRRRHCHRQIDRYSTVEKDQHVCEHSTMARMLPLWTLLHCVIWFFCAYFFVSEAWQSDATAKRTEEQHKITINKRLVDSKAERISQPVVCALVRVDKGKGMRDVRVC